MRRQRERAMPVPAWLVPGQVWTALLESSLRRRKEGIPTLQQGASPSHHPEGRDRRLAWSRGSRPSETETMRNVLARLFKKSPAITSSPLTPQGLLASDLWIDRPDAHQKIQARLKSREISPEQAERLRHFVDRGYMTFPSALPERA